MKIGIIGAGGHAKVVADIARFLKYDEIYFFDDVNKTNEIKSLGKYVGKINKVDQFKDIPFIVAIGDNNLRKKFFLRLEEKKIKIISLIHPSSYVSSFAKIGKGSVVMPKSVINISVKISKSCIINTASSIDHDTIINQFSHICPGVNLAGGVKIGKHTLVGIGTKVIPNINIGSNVIIAAGSTVYKNIRSNQVFYNNHELNIYEKK